MLCSSAELCIMWSFGPAMYKRVSGFADSVWVRLAQNDFIGLGKEGCMKPVSSTLLNCL